MITAKETIRMESTKNFELSFEKAAVQLQDYFKTIQNNFPHYEERKEQKDFIRLILKGYKMKKHIFAEAPTGTGKSLGYLLPYLVMRKQLLEGEQKKKFLTETTAHRLCITTNTIALQEQLFYKDLPAFRDMLNEDFTFSLVKGRGNYICPRNLKSMLKDGLKVKTPDEAAKVDTFINEIYSQENDELLKGDRSDINTVLPNHLFAPFATNSRDCSGQKCPEFKNCPFFAAQKVHEAADILVTNHAMTLNDGLVKREGGAGLYPHCDFMVVDEAHMFEDVALRSFETNLSFNSIKNKFDDMTFYFMYGRGKEIFSQNVDFKEDMIYHLREATNIYAELMVSFMDQLKRKKTDTLNSQQYVVDEGLIQAFMDEIKGIQMGLKAFQAPEDLQEETAKYFDNYFRKPLDSLLTNIEDMLEINTEFEVAWIEMPLQGLTEDDSQLFTKVHWMKTPIRVNKHLENMFFSKLDSVVLASATLGSNNFNLVAQSLGVRDFIGYMFQSPFDYEKQSKVYMPLQSPSPKNREQHTDFLKHEILKLVKLSKGRALVLFTSYDALKKVGDAIEVPLLKEGISVLRQGDMPRTKLINSFKEDVTSVLLATSSYWEGIDVQGESLSHVIITKLPFEVPNTPRFRELEKMYQAENRNPFAEIHLPTAIMKFKQGCGRLIRTQNDRGVISLLDSRLYRSNYGNTFLEALPKMNIIRTHEEVSSFFEQNDTPTHQEQS